MEKYSGIFCNIDTACKEVLYVRSPTIKISRYAKTKNNLYQNAGSTWNKL